MEQLLTEKELQKWESLIEGAKKILLCAHVGPDGDAIGSTLALKHWLTRKGKQARVVVPNSFPDFLRWLPGADEVQTFMKHEEEMTAVIAEADLIIVADLNSSPRLREMEALVLANPAPRIMIDHHLDPGDFCQLVISHPEMCATAEVVCHLFSQLGELDSITEEEATCLYTAMMCDTGAFTYNSNRAVVFECISHLLARGIDKDKIYRNVYFTCSPARMKLQGYLLYVKMRIVKTMHASIMTLTNSERKLIGVRNGDTEGMVNMPLQISGMRLSVFLSEDTEKEGLIKVSLRSVDDFPCNEMSARFFNGGGHKNASGGRLECTMDEAVERVMEAIRYYEPLLK